MHRFKGETMKKIFSYLLLVISILGISSGLNSTKIEASGDLFKFSVKESTSQSSNLTPDELGTYVYDGLYLYVDIFMTSVGETRELDTIQAAWTYDDSKFTYLMVDTLYQTVKVGPKTSNFFNDLLMGSIDFILAPVTAGTTWTFNADVETKLATLIFEKKSYVDGDSFSIGLDFLDYNAEVGVTDTVSYDRTKISVTPLTVSSGESDASISSLTVAGVGQSVGTTGTNYDVSITYGDSLKPLTELINVVPTKGTAIVLMTKSITGTVKLGDVVTITVADGDLSETHTVTFVSVDDPILTLESLGFAGNGFSPTPTFNKDILSYNVEIPGGQQATGFSIKPVSTESYAVKEIYLNGSLRAQTDGKVTFSNLTGGTHTVLIKVLAGGMTKEYTINVTQKVLDSTATVITDGIKVSSMPNGTGVFSTNPAGTVNLIETATGFTFNVTFNESTIKSGTFVISKDGSQVSSGTLTKDTTNPKLWKYVTNTPIDKGTLYGVTFTMTAENGSSAENTFYVERAKSTSNTLNTNDVIISEGGTDYRATFTGTQFNYIIKNESTTSVNFSVDSIANIYKEFGSVSLYNEDGITLVPAGIINVSPSIGTTNYVIKVTSQSGSSKEYPLSIVKLSNDTSFAITVKRGSTTETLLTNASFEVTGNKYVANIKVPYTVNVLDINLFATHANATVQYKSGNGSFGSTMLRNLDGSVTFNGVNEQTLTFIVTVTAENKTTTDYEISVIREAANTINTLSDLKIAGVQPNGFIADQIPPTNYGKLVLDPALIAGNLFIDATVTGGNSNGLTQVKYEYKASTDTIYSTGASIAYVRGVIYDIKVTVTSEANVPRVYQTQVVVADQNNTMDSIVLENNKNEVIGYSWNAATTSYTIDVAGSVDRIKIIADAVSDSAKITTPGDINGYVTLNAAGTNTTIKVFATSESEDKGTEYTYTIRRQALRSNTDIGEISVLVSSTSGSETLIPSFDAAKNAYFLRIDSTYNASVTVKATLPAIDHGSHFANNATIYTDTQTIIAGNTETYIIRVTAENGSTRDYKVMVQRANNSTNFENIVLNGTTYNFAQFSGGVLDLTSIQLPFSQKDYSLVINPSSTSKATVYNTNPSLISGKWVFTSTGVIEFQFTMRAEDGVTTSLYKIKLTRLEASTDTTLKQFEFLTASGNLLQGVTPVTTGNNTTYTIRVDRGVVLSQIVAVKNHPNATINQQYTDLTFTQGGNKQFTITVTAEDTNYVHNYHVVVTQKNDNNEINDIEIADVAYDFSSHTGTVDLGKFLFSKKTFVFTVTQADAYQKLYVDNVLVTLDVNKQFTYALKQGVNQIKIQSESEFGTKGTIYTYSYEQAVASSEALLSSLTGTAEGSNVLDGIPLSLLMEKSLGREYLNKVITIEAVAGKNGTVISGNGSTTLLSGLNSFKVVVQSEDGTTRNTYTVNIYVVSSNADITNIQIDKLSGYTFNPTDYAQDLGVFNFSDYEGKLGIRISYTDAYAKLYVDGVLKTSDLFEYALKTGANTITIKVIAEDGVTEEIYTLSYTRNEAKKENKLQGLEVIVNGVNQLVGFNPTTNSYELRVDRSVADVNIIGTINPADLSKITGNGVKVVNPGVDNIYSIVVTAEDGSSNSYQVKVIAKNDNNEITNITIGGITYDFSTHSGTVDLGNFLFSIKTFVFTVTQADAYQKLYVDGALVTLDSNKQFTYTLKQGINQITIQAESEYGTKGTLYTYQYEQDVASSDAELSSLTATVQSVNILSGVPLNFTTEVTLDRTFLNKVITVTGVAGKNGSIVSGNGNKTLVSGLNTFIVVVKSEDGTTTSEYTLKVYVVSSTATVTNIQIDKLTGYTFDAAELTQDLGVFNSSDHEGKLGIRISYTDAYAKLYVDGQLKTSDLFEYTLKTGSNTITIRVVAEDDITEKVYTLSYTRNEAKKENKLQTLEVLVGGVNQLVGFNPTTNSYELRVDRSVADVNIIGTINPADLSKITGNGVKVVNPGVDNIYSIVVTAEDGSSNSYQVKVIAKNDNNEITNITIGGITYDFSSHSGTVDLGSFPFSKKTFIFTVTQADAYQKLSVDGALVTLDSNKQFTYTLKQGVNQITIQAESEYGTKGTLYTYEYEQLIPSSNAILKSINGSIDGTNRLADLVIDNIMTIRLDRSFAGRQINLVALADENGTIVSGNGIKPLQLGKNEFKFVVRSEDGSNEAEYILSIYVANDDTDVSGIKLNNQLIDGFDKLVSDYEIKTPFKWNATLINLAVSMTNPNHYASITGTGNQNLFTGVNTFDIVIRSEYRNLINDASQDVIYTVTVTKNEAYTDINLADLVVLDNNDNPLTFDSVATYKPGTYNYTITLPKTASVTSVLIDPVLKDADKQTLSGDYGVKTLTPGLDGTIKQSYTFVVTAEDGTFREYSINVLQGTTLSSDTSIKGVSLRDFFANEYLINDQSFDPLKTRYEITVPYGVTNLNLTVTPNDSKAVVSGNGEYSIGTTLTITFYVTAEDKTEGTRYEIIVTRNAPSNDATLKELTISSLDSTVLVGDASLTPTKLVFNPSTLVYRITLDRTHEFIDINAIANHAGATVSGDISTQFLLGGGTTSLKITVKAEDNKTQKTYFVYVDVKNSDIEVETLEVLGYTVAYDKETLFYDLGMVAIGTQHVDIDATISDPYGTLTGTGRFFLVDGENLFKVTATSEDKSKTITYTIRVERPKGDGTGPISTDNKLYDLLIEGTKNNYPLNFNENTFVYDIELDYNDGQFNLNAIKNPRASVTGAGFHSLQPGQTKAILVTVTAEDGTVGVTYTVNVTRSLGDSDNQLSEFYIIENGIKRLLDETKTYQEVVIASNTTEIEIGATGPSTAKISGLGVVPIDTNDQFFTVIVTSENGNPKAYNIRVMKVSSDATLKELTVLDNTTQTPINYNPVFDPNTLNYNIDLTSFPQIVEIELIATSNSVVKDITGLGVHTLKSGIGMTTDRYSIIVTAEDGTTTKTYTVTITRNIDPEDSIAIDDLSLYGDTILYLGNDKYPTAPIQFTVSQKEYVINVPYQTQKAMLYVSNANGASIYGTGEYSLATKETVILFYMVSKSGLVQSETYTIRVVKADPSTDNTLKSLTMNGSLIPGFDPTKTSYTFDVDSALVSQVSIGATKNDPYSVLSGDLGNVPIVPGKNTINVTVIAEDGTPKVYSVTINSLSNDASIYTLGVENYSITPTFDPLNTVYRLTVDFDVTMVNIFATFHEKATVFGTGAKTLKVGVNLFTVYARSEGNTEGTRYQIEITRTEPSSDTSLKSLTVKDKNGNVLSFTGSFSPDTRDYIINLPEDANINTVLLEAETMHAKSNVYGIGNVLLGGFIDGKYHTIVKVSVMAEDGTVGEYSISFYRGVTLSDLAEIESLNLLGSDSVSYLGTLESSLTQFDGVTQSYTITVPYYVMNMNLQVTAVGTVYGNGVKLFENSNELTYNLYVVSQNGSNQTATYIIRVVKEQAEVDNTLNSLTVDGVLVKGFDPEVNAYVITMPTQSSKDNITIGATTDSNATIQGLGNKPLLAGENVFPISVIAQTGEVNTYTLTINYVHSNALLDTLLVKGVTGDTYDDESAITYFTPDEFESSTFSYVVQVGPNTTKVRLTGTTEDQESGARVSGFRTYDFPINQESRIIEIEVTSADGLQTQIYEVELVRNGKPDNNSKLNTLVVEGERLAFNPTTYSYSLSVNNNTPNIQLSAQAFSPNAKVTVLGYEQGQAQNEISIAIDDLKAGNNVVLIKVEAEDGSMSYYRLSINKDAQPDYLLTVLLIVTFLLWVITVAFFLLKLSRSKKEENRRGMII
jgi:uncharacterized protein YrzB (UPF0473 family)